MKFLLDENVSYRLVRMLEPSFPGTVHVTDVARLKGDKAIWSFAGANGYVLVTFDTDFVQFAALYGAPPKVLLLTLKNLIPFGHSRPAKDAQPFFRRTIHGGGCVAGPTGPPPGRSHTETGQADGLVLNVQMV